MWTFLRLLLISVTSVLLLFVALSLYRPLPAELTSTTNDRLAMSVFEPLARLIYYYPTRMCLTPHCFLTMQRWSMDFLARVLAPSLNATSPLYMETTHWDGVKVRVYHPLDRTSADSDGAVIYIHGGGFTFGSTEMFEPLTRTMAEEINARLYVSVDYRLAPETIFPGQIEDCESVLEYVIENGPAMYGIDPAKIVVMGDSAGGNLAAVLSQRRKASKAQPKIRGQVLIYPMVQMSNLRTHSYRHSERELAGLALLDPRNAAFFLLTYFGIDLNKHPEYEAAVLANGHVSERARALCNKYLNYSLLPASFLEPEDTLTETKYVKELAEHMEPFLTNPDVAPLMAPDLSHLPAALVITAGFDILRDEGGIYAGRLKQAGVPTRWSHYEHGFHAMVNAFHSLDIGREAVTEIVDWTRKIFRGAEE